MPEKTRLTLQAVVLAQISIIGLLLYFASGCDPGARSVESREKSTSGTSSNDQKVDFACLSQHIENPPESYHYSFKTTDGQDAVDKEADITPQTMDITIQDKSGAHKYHGEHSDEASWSNAIVALTGSGLIAMTARMELIQKTSALKRTGNESVNGYATTRYSVDTTSANASDARSFRTMFGAGSYDKGNLWVTDQGCPVKLVLDDVMQQTNGSVDHRHFEIILGKR